MNEKIKLNYNSFPLFFQKNISKHNMYIQKYYIKILNKLQQLIIRYVVKVTLNWDITYRQ